MPGVDWTIKLFTNILNPYRVSVSFWLLTEAF